MSSDDPMSVEFLGNLLQQYRSAMDAQDFEDATSALHGVFAIAQKRCDENPSLFFDQTRAAAEREDHADWGGAESMYNQMLSLSDVEPYVEYRARTRLVSLCQLLRRESDALDHARRATAAARRLEFAVLISKALRNEARCLIRSGHINEACNVIANAISVIDDEKMYDQMNASILTLRAECAIRNGALADAERDLEQASTYLEPLAEMAFAAGVHHDLAQRWSITARLHAERGDRDKAIAAWQKAVFISKHVASLPHAQNVYTKVTVADMLKGLADALLVGDRADDAAKVFDERKEILVSVGVPAWEAE